MIQSTGKLILVLQREILSNFLVSKSPCLMHILAIYMFPVQLRLSSIVMAPRSRSRKGKWRKKKKHSGSEELDGLFLEGLYRSRDTFHVGKK
jgi:hypothetical protein